jgi:hypothetical protein
MQTLSSATKLLPARKYVPAGHALASIALVVHTPKPMLFWNVPGGQETHLLSSALLLDPYEGCSPMAHIAITSFMAHSVAFLVVEKVFGGHSTHMLSSNARLSPWCKYCPGAQAVIDLVWQFNGEMMVWNIPAAHGLHENLTVVVGMLVVSVVGSIGEPDPVCDPPLLPDALPLFSDDAMPLFWTKGASAAISSPGGQLFNGMHWLSSDVKLVPCMYVSWGRHSDAVFLATQSRLSAIRSVL